MSYIKINLGGEDRGLKFNQGALIEFQKKIDQSNIEGTTGYALIWAGLKANAYVKGEEFTTSFEQVCDWVDELPIQTSIDVMNCFKETQAFKSLIPEEEESKKKSPPKNMKSKA